MGKARHNSNKREMLYMATVSGKQEELVIELENGEKKKYTLQHPGARAGMELRDKAVGANGAMEQTKLWEGLMSKVIFIDGGKRTNWDYWEEEENFAHQTEVFKAASNFLVGKSNI
ncbi:hypothetical protein OJ967_12340 [Peribacillus frigoritolerans]|uniref:hypothetical protein n=1 Tax=Peribacillus frigoritolerans TaxID=450367 RepID=UPI00222689EE|nr:hypothetical protein [Peribacillus frigoritolerans]UYZ01212.1 hypothetical protein OJ967_12340 [Peribacillus frigoritolerans]